MLKMYVITLVFVVANILASLAHDDGESKAVQYTTEEFSASISAVGLLSKNHFVMFYAPWCGHCSRLAPTWEELATIHNNEDGVTIAKVDCTVETSLCSDHDVTGYPTLKFFTAGEVSGVKYRGARDLTALSDYIDEQLGTSKKPDTPGELDVPKPVNGLFELTDDSFTKHIENGKHFIKFYAPWCGHCQKLAPTWEALAKSLEYSTDVTIAKVDCTAHRTVCNEFEIKGYPTLLWMEDGKKVEKYQGQRTHEDMKAFITRMVGPSDTDSSTEEVGVEEGPVISLSGDNFEHGIANGVSFIKFFAPWCGHCKRLAPTWEELGKKFVGNALVKIVKVDCTLDNSKDLCNQQDVDGFPTLFLYRDGEKVAEYNGSRSLDDLYEFISKHLPHDEL